MRTLPLACAFGGCLPAAVLAGVFAGCSGPQRILAPKGPAAEELAWLTWVLLAGVVIPTVVTFVLFGVAVWKGLRRKDDAPAPDEKEERWLLYVGGAVVLILFGLLAVNIRTSGRVMTPPTARAGEPGAVEVEVLAHQFWWEFAYPAHGVVTANELVVPAGEEVRLLIASADVIHSFWVPELHGKQDATPGHVRDFWIKADGPGDYRGQCAEFCGMQHALMSFWVRAVPREEYERWLAHQRRAATDPVEGKLLRGQQAFATGGCNLCHVVRGVFDSAAGEGAAQTPGPDLTHLASRETLASATVPLTRETLKSFILDPHVLKPGARMPPTAVPEEELDALLDWLLSLE